MDPQYEELTWEVELRDGDQYYSPSTEDWVTQRGHTGKLVITGYRWRRKRTLPLEAVHFL